MALPERKRQKVLVGADRPRVAPPWPLKANDEDFLAVATELELDLYPWQRSAARYIHAVGPDGKWSSREIAIIVARQNGKSTLLIPLIVSRLRKGQRIMHTAQNRKLPAEVFLQVADIMAQDQTLFPKRNGRPVRPRYANGQEEIRLNNGGSYRIVAPTSAGSRGQTNDLVIIDELRELDEFAFYGGARSTLLKSENGQIVLLSNAGTDESIVLNAVKSRADSDPDLAYLEWSAAPERASDDHAGWVEANPAIGHDPTVLDSLEREYRTHSLQGTLAIFETENLCRWVTSMRERLVGDAEWLSCRGEKPPRPVRPVLGVALDPEGKRASVALAWAGDGKVWVRLLFDFTGNPVDTDKLGAELRQKAMRLGVVETGYDPLSDPELAKYVKKSKSISGQTYAAASAQFVNLVAAGNLRWIDADAVSDDLTWTSRKPDGTDGSYHAVRAQDDRPITAALAAIRAVWLASGPKPPSSPRIR